MGVIVKLILLLLCFIPLSLWILIWLTWRFTHEEIKVRLSAGTMVVTRLFDGKNAKDLAEVKIKDIECFEKYSEAKMQKRDRDNVIYATHNANPLHHILEKRASEYSCLVSYDGCKIVI